jgi:hypothetical protein
MAAYQTWLAMLGDAYAASFARRGLFRTKLVALLAMLESGAPHHRRFDTIGRSPAGAWLRLSWWGLMALVKLVAGAVVFGPFHLWSMLFGRRDPAAEEGSA